MVDKRGSKEIQFICDQGDNGEDDEKSVNEVILML